MFQFCFVLVFCCCFVFLWSTFINQETMRSLFTHSSANPTKDELKYKAINKVRDVVCFLLSCRKYFCKYVESIKYLLDSASFDDSDKTIMYRGVCVDKMWLCNLCTFATRPIKVLFSYFKIVCLSVFCLIASLMLVSITLILLLW